MSVSLFEQADADRSGTLTKNEFKRALKQPRVVERLKAIGTL